MERRKIKKGVKRIGVLIFTLIILLFLFEVSLRLFYPQPVFKHSVVEASAQIFIDSDYLPFDLKPLADVRHLSVVGEFDVSNKINILGYRGEDFAIRKSFDEKRILVLGDSFTFGFGVEENETYAEIFDARLDRHYNVINAGYKSGRSSDTQYLYLKNEGLKLDPDVVILGFFVGNDFGDYRNNLWEFENNEITKITSKVHYIDEDNRERRLDINKEKSIKNVLYDFNVFLSFKSHFYVLFKESFRGVLSNIYSGRPGSNIYSVNYSKDTQTDIDTNLDFILKMKNIADGNNVSFVLLVIPAREQVYNYSVKDRDGNLLDWEKPNIILKEFADKNSIIIIDLLPYFRESTGLYFDVDPHWSGKGHSLAGNIIYNELLRRKIIDSKPF